LKPSILMKTSRDWPSKMAMLSLTHEVGQTQVPVLAQWLNVF
jgi:hypothetical protein